MDPQSFRRDGLPALLTLVAGAVTLVAALVFRDQAPVGQQVAKYAGFVVLYAGMGLVVWAGMHIKSAIGGLVSPRLDTLVVTGPYAHIRHPVYLGTTLAMLGVVIVTRSWYGLVCLVVLFVPVEVHRARLEDAALAGKFGKGWREYASRTGSFLPGVGKS